MTVLRPQYPYPLALSWRLPSVSRFTLFTLGLMCASPFHCASPPIPPAQQSECVQNLKSLYTQIIASQQEETPAGGSRPSLLTFGFSPERKNRYAYFLGPGPMEERRGLYAVQLPRQMGIGVDTFEFRMDRELTFRDLPPDIAQQVGIRVNGSTYDFVAACAGNIDYRYNDSPDIWTISSRDREINGEHVMAGEPYSHVNDLTSN
ncbi:MAG TPA: hypothetical protein VF815_06365 [Myxococcaceae bacterium]